MKKISKTARRVKFFSMISRLSLYAQCRGIHIMPTCFYRTAAEQKKCIAEGTSKIKRSSHQDWLAIDFVIIVGEDPCWSR